MHNNGLIHRDVKPENILITKQNRAKLADFGCSCKEEAATHALCSYDGSLDTMGSQYFTPPEGFLSLKGRYDLDKRADMWALGLTLYQILFGQRAPNSIFSPMSRLHSEAQIRKFNISVDPHLAELRPRVRKLLMGLLQQDPSQRLTSTQALAEVEKWAIEVKVPRAYRSAPPVGW